MFAELPELWLPPSNFAVTPVLGLVARESPVGVVDPAEVHAVYRVPLADLLDPEHRVSVRHPSGWVGPGFLVGPDHDLVLWGFTAGIISRLLDFLGWTRGLGRAPGPRSARPHAAGGPRPAAPPPAVPRQSTQETP